MNEEESVELAKSTLRMICARCFNRGDAEQVGELILNQRGVELMRETSAYQALPEKKAQEEDEAKASGG